MADQKISELTAASSVAGSDISVLVHAGTDYQYTFAQILTYISGNLSVGATITFTDTTPANSSGRNGDLVIKPTTGQFWQRVAGVWVQQYTVPAAGSGNTVLYGSGTPNNGTGNDGDTYIKTDGGIFYKKAAGVWGIVFTMATGPQGEQGDPGADGADGTNGNTILSGTTPPSNIDDGVNGDYYINYNTLYIYGPKAAGVWPAGRSIINNAPGFKQAYNYSVSDTRFVYDSLTMELTFTLSSGDQILFPYDSINGILKASIRQKYGSNSYKDKNFEPIITDDGSKYISVLFEGIDTDMITNSQIILY